MVKQRFFVYTELHGGRQVNMLTVQSKLEEIVFKTKMECNYARDPYTKGNFKASTSEDVLQHTSAIKGPFGVGTACSPRKLPHGCGTLETATGEIIYSGDWLKGKIKEKLFKNDLIPRTFGNLILRTNQVDNYNTRS